MVTEHLLRRFDRGEYPTSEFLSVGYRRNPCLNDGEFIAAKAGH